MAYVRDDKTGKFTWVEGQVGDDDGPYRGPTSRGGAQAPTGLLAGLLVVCVLGAVTMYGMRTFKDPSIAIKRIRNHPTEFDGQQVLVRGQIGEVFQVGASYAYYLMQGPDTLVVFSSGERPRTRPNAAIRGSISIGYLDGTPHPALFESRQ